MAQFAVPFAIGAIASLVVTGVTIGVQHLLAKKLEGPKSEDGDFQVSTYGKVIPRQWGTDRKAGNVIWADRFLRKRHTSGGKGLGPGTDSFTYRRSFAVSLGEAGMGPILKMWDTKKIIYDATDSSKGSVNYKWLKFTLYDGNAAQAVPALIETWVDAKFPVGSSPAFRGQTIIVFDKYRLGAARGIPQIEVVVASNGQQAFPVDIFSKTSTLLPGGALLDLNRNRAYLLFGRTTSGSSTTIVSIDTTTGTVVKEVDTGVLKRNGEGADATVDPEGFLYFASATNNTVFKFDPESLTQIASYSFPAGSGNVVTALQWININDPDAGSAKFLLTGHNLSKWSWINRETMVGPIVDHFTDTGDSVPEMFTQDPDTLRVWMLHGGSLTQMVPVHAALGIPEFSLSTIDISATINNAESLDYLPARDQLLIASSSGTDILPNGEGIALIDVGSSSYGEVVGTLDTDTLGKVLVNEGSKWLAQSGVWGYLDEYVVVEEDNSPRIRFIDLDTLTERIDFDMDDWIANIDKPVSGGYVYNPANRSLITDQVDATQDGAILYVGRNTPSTEDLAVIVSNICVSCGLTVGDIDVTDLVGVTVQGFDIQRQSRGIESLEELSFAYMFDVAEIDFKLVFTRRGNNLADSGTSLGTQSSTTLQDTSKVWVVNEHSDAGRVVILRPLTGTEETFPIVSNTVDTLTITGPWLSDPSSDLYEIRSRAYPTLLDADDFGTDSDFDTFPTEITPSNDVPMEVQLEYKDAAREYQTNVAKAKRTLVPESTSQSEQVSPKKLATVMTEQESSDLAKRWLIEQWIGRQTTEIKLLPRNLLLDPTGLVTIPAAITGDLDATARLDSFNVGSNFAIEAKTSREDINTYTRTADISASDAFQKQAVPSASSSKLFIFDTNLLRDEDGSASIGTGFYVGFGAYDDGWNGATLFKNNFGEWDVVTSLDTALTWGSTTSVLADASDSYATWNRDQTLNVSIAAGNTLSSVTKEQVYAGMNAAAVRSTTGWEVIQFTTATDNGGGQWTISELLRGRRGTEIHVANHVTGSNFVLLEQANLTRVSLPISDIGQIHEYRAVSTSQDFDDAFSDSTLIEGNDAKPYATTHIEAVALAGDDVLVRCIRRSRIGGRTGWGVLQESVNPDPPLSLEFVLLEKTTGDESASVTQTETDQPMESGAGGGFTLRTGGWVEDSGTSTGSSPTTLVDTTPGTWTTDEHSKAQRVVVLRPGSGTEETFRIASNTNDTLTIAGTWASAPSSDSYEIRNRIGTSVIEDSGVSNLSGLQIGAWCLMHSSGTAGNDVHFRVLEQPNSMSIVTDMPDATNDASTSTNARIKQLPTYAVFTAAQISAAGYSVGEAINVNVYQRSASVGRGHTGSDTVTPL